ncbi:EscI/YscI/HrpB family type III secretion system inner rod protein [Photorhabdus laumondii subsp. laumondii]|uniref:Type III secretion component protein SctI n=2 Tax=Photorhabdus laumondii subsp. laumondii TaxID=141679 RepID=Q7N0U5_PHOLL|nr:MULTISPECIES: type III secretion system inner rod subunit SctI [Photorhabdus]AWK43400.1 EscI/YscI/HrpB family type III secretion system inner rod protein [Photorhabdus laumondii subsp. laumondii]AXG44076.1 EscI/YscI/HrpB family type III secretion system inner rod protein [Photorhabdus laumondii subsp. laumondii]AXG48709.1 EscI/YscI/HrpB family type III secretion system inner rod protein [Photorhabdus laumondii subsp. laumondii]KTL60222.1 preprotein translocase I [Photorhabdus laumondii subsp
MDLPQISETLITSLDELNTHQASAENIASFEHAMSNQDQGIENNLINELGQLRQQLTQAKQDLETQLAVSGSDPNSLMQMQWSLMRITLQEELIAKTVGRLNQNIETLMKAQ